MGKDFAKKFKKLIRSQTEQDDSIVGTVLSVKPMQISCHGGQWLLTADDLQISNHVALHVGESVLLSGQDPFTIVSVLSDTDADEYEPSDSAYDDAELRQLIAGKQDQGDYALKSELPTVPTEISAFANDAGYLTEHQDLSGYAQKTELPTVPTKVSELENDKGYVTKNVTGDFSASGSIGITSKSKGYYLVDSSGASYPAMYDNNANLWIGAPATAATHHVGETLISSGYSATNKAGNPTISISVPNATNTGATNYKVIHTGNTGTILPYATPAKRGGAQMYAGTFTMDSVAGGSYGDKTYTFPSAFSGTPNVVICKYVASPGTSTSGASARTLSLTATTTTTIKVRAYNNGSSAWTPVVSFFAIYLGS